MNCFNSNEIRQYLFQLHNIPQRSIDVRQLKSNTHVGKLDIVWRTNMGEKGRLQTSALQRIVSLYPGFPLTPKPEV